MPFKNEHPLYNVWKGVNMRCTNPRFKQWSDYGGRGIAVCERWSIRGGEGFRNFLSDMGDRPPGFVIDRINNDAGYSPENCKWVSKKDSQRNQRVTRFVTVQGVKYKASDLADIAGIKTDGIIERAKRGLTYAEVISTERRRDLSGLAVGHKYGRGAGKHKNIP